MCRIRVRRRTEDEWECPIYVNIRDTYCGGCREASESCVGVVHGGGEGDAFVVEVSDFDVWDLRGKRGVEEEEGLVGSYA